MRDLNIPGCVLHTQEEKRQLLLNTGIRIGAECLRRLRDARDCQTTGYTGNRFCQPAAGFVRISELFRISPQTCLIAASTSDDGRKIRREKSLLLPTGAARTTELAMKKTLFSLFNQPS